MTLLNCDCKYDCTGIAVVASLIIGIIAAFLQITAVITLTPVFYIVAFGIAVLYLAVTLIATTLSRKETICHNACTPIGAILFGIITTIFAAIVLLAISFAATSVVGAIIVGILFFAFSLMILSVACLVKCFATCRS